MKPDDDAAQWQIEKPVHEGAGFPLAAQEDEEFRPRLGLQDVRETKDSEQNHGKDFNRSLHPLLRVDHLKLFPGTWWDALARPLHEALSASLAACGNALNLGSTRSIPRTTLSPMAMAVY